MAKHKTHVAEREKVALSVKGSDIAKKLLTMDGRDLIRTRPDQSVDLIFSDLPYGINYFIGAKSGENMKGQYDDSAESAKDFIADVVPHMVRVVKPTGWIVLFMCYEWHMWLQESLLNACTVHAGYREKISDNFCNALKSSTLACHFLRPELPPWIWTRRGKGNHGHYPELHASNRYEMLVVVNGGKAHLTKKPVENVLDFAPFSDERLHAMQKPHDLCCEIIDRTTVPGELVLDICMGSGAHLAAAASKGRDFLGCDKNPDNLGAALGLVSQYYHRGMK
jgi:DNA modification methylase